MIPRMKSPVLEQRDLSPTRPSLASVQVSHPIPQGTVQVTFSIGAPLENDNRVLNPPDRGTTIQIVKVRDNSEFVPLMQRLARNISTALGQKDGSKED